MCRGISERISGGLPKENPERNNETTRGGLNAEILGVISEIIFKVIHKGSSGEVADGIPGENTGKILKESQQKSLNESES